MDVFKAGAKWIIGRDSELNFWMDNWAPQGPIRNLVQRPLNRDEGILKIKDVISANGWNWDKISLELPSRIKMEIQATPYAVAARSEDRLAWSNNSHGKFDWKSAYILATPSDECHEFKRHWIWKSKIIPRIQFFVWKCFHNSIGVKACLASRGINLDSLCPQCREEPETIIHMLQDCWRSKETWKQLGITEEDSNFFSSDLHTWLSANATKDHHNGHNHPPWKFVFLFAIWMLWKQRNKTIFHNRNYSSNLTAQITSQASDFYWCAADWRVANSFTLKDIRWERPRSNWSKLNTNGSSMGNMGLAGGEG